MNGDVRDPLSDATGEPVAAPDLDAVSDAVDTPEAAPVAPAAPAPRIERPSADVAPVPAASRMPGAAREGYAQLPTAPVITNAPAPEDEAAGEWEPADVAVSAPHGVVGPWALGLAIVAIVASLFVGWMLPLGLVAVIVAIVTLRRPGESRAIGVWALVLGALALIYSAGWLLWALPQLPTV